VKRSFVLTPEAKADLREILLDIADDSPEQPSARKTPVRSRRPRETLKAFAEVFLLDSLSPRVGSA